MPPSPESDTSPARRPQTAFGHNLRQARRRAGLSQERLAFRASLHPTEISLLERGARDAQLATIVRLARALEVPPGRLLDGLDP